MNINSAFKAFFGAFTSICCCAQAQEPLLQNLHLKVVETVYRADQIPGLKSEEFESLRPGIIERWNRLVENGELVVSAADKETRPYFVALQGIVEHVLSKELNKSVKDLIGVIHTPMPATPLCTEGEISENLVHPEIASDPARLFTVKARTTVVRDYLYQGGDLYIIYPKEGLSKRSEKQQEIYRRELNNYPAHLFDRPLNCTEIDPELIGATYFFRDDEGDTYAFAIKMTQANNPLDIGNFGLWFGKADHPAIKNRIDQVFEFINKYDPFLK